jgi:hypothetical protein
MCDSNSTLQFVSTSELEFFLQTGVVTQNSNSAELDLYNFLKKYQIFHNEIKEVTLKMTLYRTMSKNKNCKKVKIQDSMGKNKKI